MAHVLPVIGYISAYGVLTMHNGTTRRASSYVKATMRALDQSVVLPDGRVLDLGASENTIWVPDMFKQRYFISESAVGWMRSVLEAIDNATATNMSFYEADGGNTYTASGRMLRCVDVSSIDIHNLDKMEIECTYRIHSDWA